MSKSKCPEGLAHVLHTRRTDVAAAMAGLCKAVKVVGECRDALEKHLRHVYPATEDDKALIGLSRAAKHLTHAVTDVPEELWAVMVADCIEDSQATILAIREQLGRVA